MVLPLSTTSTASYDHSGILWSERGNNPKSDYKAIEIKSLIYQENNKMILLANIYIVLTIIIVLFQLALVCGAPLGEYTMGGKFPGKLPLKMRIAALIQIFILLLFASVVIAKAGISLEQYHSIGRIGIWFVVAFFVLGSIVNLLSPSRKEKLIMGPANLIALIITLLIAIR